MVDSYKKEIEDFRKEIDQKGQEAEKKLDEILSEEGMEFCSRCGRKINSRMDWGGRCMEKGCNNLICKDCWADPSMRYCLDHRKRYRPEHPKEKKKISPDKQIFRDEKVKSLTLNYMDSMEERFRKNSIDWVPFDYFKNPVAKVKKSKYGEFMLVVYSKFLIFKRKKIQIMIYPLDYMASMQSDLNRILEKIDRKVHNIGVFVSDSNSITKDITGFFGTFSNKCFSLYLVDSEGKKLYFNREDPVTRNYASWFDVGKYPLRIRGLLKSFSEKTSGRNVITAKRASKEFGISEEEAMKFLGKMDFLTPIDETDSFLFKEEEK